MQIPFQCNVASIRKCSAFADVKNVLANLTVLMNYFHTHPHYDLSHRSERHKASSQHRIFSAPTAKPFIS